MPRDRNRSKVIACYPEPPYGSERTHETTAVLNDFNARATLASRVFFYFRLKNANLVKQKLLTVTSAYVQHVDLYQFSEILLIDAACKSLMN